MRRLALVLLVALGPGRALSQNSSNGSNGSNSSLITAPPGYPLLAPTPSETCTCATSLGSGWNGGMLSCRSGSFTSCSECDQQTQCANVSSPIGNGAPLFQGDCRGLGACPAATGASLSYPVSIAIDPQDNLYIADHGNNRVRMYVSSTETLVTIAGNGMQGFGGDGGLAILAPLRSPSGIAWKKGVTVNLTTGVGSEVYFSDLYNQRVRRLVLAADGWHIYTVVGTGEKGDNSLCDISCVATTQARLNGPRALAFDSTQVLYFVDSGNLKIRMLHNGIMSTFAGAGGGTVEEATFIGLAQALLPGHWSQGNTFISVRTLSSLVIDDSDFLWFHDSSFNRLSMLALKTLSSSQMYGDTANIQLRYTEHFGHNITQRLAWNPLITAGFQVWFPVEPVFQNRSKNAFLASSISTPRYLPGANYWRFGQTTPGAWCPGMSYQFRTDCKQAVAQTWRSSRLMGMCTDAVGSVYIVDQGASEVLFLTPGDYKRGPTVIDSNGVPLTTSNCPCMQYWVSRVTPSTQTPDQCRDNPVARAQLAALIPNSTSAGLDARLDPCTATNFCASSDGLPNWCYVNTSIAAGNCRVVTWGFCNANNVGNSFPVLKPAAIYGNEIRLERIRWLSPSVAPMVLGTITEDLWANNTLLPGYPTVTTPSSLAILKGFVSASLNLIPPQCANTNNPICCGLPTLALASTTNLKLSGLIRNPKSKAVDASNGTACLMQTSGDLNILKAFLDAQQADVLTVWWETITLNPQGSASGGIMNSCKSFCALTKPCRSYMAIQTAKDQQGISPSQPCQFFSTNFPYYMYSLDRSVGPFVNGVLPSSVKPFAARENFGGAVQPVPRLAGVPNGLYVPQPLYGNSTATYTAPYLYSRDVLGAPDSALGLQLGACQDACSANPSCMAIAFPGCYLLKRNDFPLQSQNGSMQTFVAHKLFANPTVRGVAGYTGVPSDAGDNSTVQEALFNKPTACAVDSQGNLLVADTWNHRIRKVTGVQTPCHVNDKYDMATTDTIKTYVNALANVQGNCTSDPQMATIFAAMQAQAWEQRTTDILVNNFCSFKAPYNPDPGALTNYTYNTLVLCQVCAGIVPRPRICPWPSMCGCRDAIVQALTSTGYVACSPQRAYYDKWHRFLTSYAACWWQPSAGDATWWSNQTKRLALLQGLRAYVGWTPNATNGTNGTNGTNSTGNKSGASS